MNWVFLDANPWDYDAGTPLVRPLGGSQSALCYLATALARSGQRVTTLTGTTKPGVIDNVSCLNFAAVSGNVFAPADTVTVVLNGTASVAQNLRQQIPAGRPLVLWTQHAHDQPVMQDLRDPAGAALWDRIVCISDWQRIMFHRHLGVPVEKMDVLRNAIGPRFENLFQSADHMAATKSGALRLAYTSTPFRGLNVLVAIFPAIHGCHPDCRLDIFSSMQVYYQPAAQDQFQTLYTQCRATPGMVYRGSLSQTDLARELAQVSVLAYPNTFAETSCISVMEALAAGLLVVTSDLGALPETCGGWARLVESIGPDRGHEAFAVDYVGVLNQALEEMKADPAGVMPQRFEQVQAINRTCTWHVRAREWQDAAQVWLAAR